MADVLKFVLSLQGDYSLWTPPRPRASRWLASYLMRSISHFAV